MSGLIGTALAAWLVRDGHDVMRLVRREVRPGEHAIAWFPALGTIDREALDGWGGDVVVHLAGEPVFGRWTSAKKGRIRDSRVAGTRLLSEALAAVGRRPRVLLTASAVGYYGDRGAEDLTERSTPGNDFLARVARDWEAASAPAAAAGIRVVHLRFGVVLTPLGGALAKMLIPFRLGVGGPLGSGRQYLSWIALDDAVEVVSQLLATESISGPVNVTAPEPVTNSEFVRALGRVLGRPALVPVPPLGLRLAFGAEAAAFMMAGQRVLPARLSAAGFRFRFGAIEPALRALLAAPGGGS
jgi:uncharacterized protein